MSEKAGGTALSVPNTGGIHTVEGNVAGSRAALLEKKRQRDIEEFESKKRKIESERERSAANQTIESKFAASTVASEQEQTFRNQTIGLVTAEDFKKAAILANKIGQEDDDDDDGEKAREKGGNEDPKEKAKRLKALKKAKKKKLKEKKKMLSTLSFADDADAIDGEGDEGGADDNRNNSDKEEKKSQETGRARICSGKKDPTVDTSFLPDAVRDEEIRRRKKQLEKEWLERQKRMKLESLEITYSYWDGTGHRRTVICTKGDTIANFLELARKDLCQEFRELTNIASDDLLYIKEDLIIPQDMTFYDLIATKARGKSGPLFHFDVHDDIRLGPNDARIEKDESHPGKIVERRWYDRNKHIFPASRWEIYDPQKEYGSYTIGDSKK